LVVVGAGTSAKASGAFTWRMLPSVFVTTVTSDRDELNWSAPGVNSMGSGEALSKSRVPADWPNCAAPIETWKEGPTSCPSESEPPPVPQLEHVCAVAWPKAAQATRRESSVLFIIFTWVN